MMFALRSLPNHIPIQYRVRLNKSNRITPSYLKKLKLASGTWDTPLSLIGFRHMAEESQYEGYCEWNVLSLGDWTFGLDM